MSEAAGIGTGRLGGDEPCAEDGDDHCDGQTPRFIVLPPF